MSEPKLHHYVPQFYLRRFTQDGHFWVFDKKTDRSFRTSPKSVAAETHFYKSAPFEHTLNALFIEEALSAIEHDAAVITSQWITRLEEMKPLEKLEITRAERERFSLFVAVQWIRTLATREVLQRLLDEREHRYDPKQMATIHQSFLVLEDFMLKELAEKIEGAIWAFGRNATQTPFVTSDNPVTMHAPECYWIRWGVFNTPGVCVTLPLSESLIFFGYEKEHWSKLARFDSALSPVPFTSELVEHENNGQVCNAARFVFSTKNDFAFARQLISDGYAAVVDPKTHPRPVSKHRRHG